MPSSSSSASSTEHWMSTPCDADRRADEAGHRVAGRVGEHRDGGLDLPEAERGRGGGVGGEQQRVIEPVGDVRLVAGGAPAAQLGHGQPQLGGPQQGQHPGQLGRGGARAQPDDLGPGHVRADREPGQLGVGQGHHLRGDGQVQAVPGDIGVEGVEVLLRDPVHLHHPAIGDHQARLGVVRGTQRDQAQVGVLDREPVEVDPLLVHEPDPAHRRWPLAQSSGLLSWGPDVCGSDPARWLR